MSSELIVDDLMIPESRKWTCRFFICLQSMLKRAKCFSLFICEQSFQSLAVCGSAFLCLVVNSIC